MEINFTLLIQVGIYLALFFILKAFYFEPILRLLKRREQLTTGKKDEAGDLTKQIETLRVQYDLRMKEAREAMDAHRLETLQRVRKDADEKIHDVKTRTEKALWDYQDSLDKEAKVLRTKFTTLAGDLKKEIVDAILSSRVVRL